MKAFALGLILLVLSGCSMGTVKSDLKKTEFQAENQPIRELRLILYSRCGLDSAERTKIKATVEKASESMTRQAGISLRIAGWEVRCFDAFMATEAVMTQMYDELHHSEAWDVAVAWPGWSASGFVGNLMGLPAVSGSTDNVFRRYVVIRDESAVVLEHELWHTFMVGHGPSGVNSPVQVRLIPFTPAIGGRYLTPTERKVVLLNKWRDFAKLN